MGFHWLLLVNAEIQPQPVGAFSLGKTNRAGKHIVPVFILTMMTVDLLLMSHRADALVRGDLSGETSLRSRYEVRASCSTMTSGRTIIFAVQTQERQHLTIRKTILHHLLPKSCTCLA